MLAVLEVRDACPVMQTQAIGAAQEDVRTVPSSVLCSRKGVERAKASVVPWRVLTGTTIPTRARRTLVNVLVTVDSCESRRTDAGVAGGLGAAGGRRPPRAAPARALRGQRHALPARLAGVAAASVHVGLTLGTRVPRPAVTSVTVSTVLTCRIIVTGF